MPGSSFDQDKDIDVHADLKHATAVDSENAQQDLDIDRGFDPELVKRTVRKIDWRLIPVLAAVYTISLIDRTNLSTARAANANKMDRDLGTNIGDRYSIITVVFFAPYIVLELPSQLGLRKWGTRLWLGSAVILWGIVMIGMGFVTNWQQLAGLRALLGVFEATLFPGAAFLLATWYPRKQMATRTSIFYLISVVVGNFSSILGYGISLLDGKSGMSGWQWIFLIFGLITVVIGGMAVACIIDFPDKATFLTDEQRNVVLTRIQRDRGDSQPDPFTWAKLKKYALDWKIVLFGIFFMASTMSSYALAYFFPFILGAMGFDQVESMVLNAPPNAYSLLPAIGSAFIADRYKNMRGPVIMFNACCIVIGTAMYSQLPATAKAARYAGTFLATGGGNANVPLILSWSQTSIRAQSKRAYSSAFVVAMGGVGGIAASLAFKGSEMLQGYPTGAAIVLAFNGFVVVGAGALSVWMRAQNKRADRAEVVLEESEEFRYQG